MVVNNSNNNNENKFCKWYTKWLIIGCVIMLCKQ